MASARSAPPYLLRVLIISGMIGCVIWISHSPRLLKPIPRIRNSHSISRVSTAKPIRRGSIRCTAGSRNAPIPRYQYFEAAMLAGRLELDDFVEQLETFESSGGLMGLMERLPEMQEQINSENVLDTENRINRYRAIISKAMEEERKNFTLLSDHPTSWERQFRLSEESGYPLETIQEFCKDYHASLNSFREERQSDIEEPVDKVIPLVMASTAFWHPDRIKERPIKNDFEMSKFRKRIKKAKKKKEANKQKGFG